MMSDLCIGKNVPKLKVKSSRAPWIDAEIVHLSHKKETARKKANRSGKPTYRYFEIQISV